jgi:sortase A
MRNKAGIFCMVLGAALIFGALTLFLHNQQEAMAAEAFSVKLMPQLMEEIKKAEESTVEPQTYIEPVGTPIEYLDPGAFIMTEVEIDGYSYIGYLSIPKLDLELPVMADWDDSRLRIAPCRYAGSVRGEDLVIMAHNYVSHFGPLSSLSEGDSVIFTDMDGITTVYQVVVQDILAPSAVEEMTSGDFDLTLFTCTYGGNNRFTVYCDRTE